jgi:hypothetical protein
VAVVEAPKGPAVKEGYIASTFHEGPIPQDYLLLDQVRDHAKGLRLAGKMASCRDKDTVKLKFCRSFFGSAMPHDVVGGFAMSNHVLKNTGFFLPSRLKSSGYTVIPRHSPRPPSSG